MSVCINLQKSIDKIIDDIFFKTVTKLHLKDPNGFFLNLKRNAYVLNPFFTYVDVRTALKSIFNSMETMIQLWSIMKLLRREAGQLEEKQSSKTVMFHIYPTQ